MVNILNSQQWQDKQALFLLYPDYEQEITKHFQTYIQDLEAIYGNHETSVAMFMHFYQPSSQDFITFNKKDYESKQLEAIKSIKENYAYAKKYIQHVSKEKKHLTPLELKNFLKEGFVLAYDEQTTLGNVLNTLLFCCRKKFDLQNNKIDFSHMEEFKTGEKHTIESNIEDLSPNLDIPVFIQPHPLNFDKQIRDFYVKSFPIDLATQEENVEKIKNWFQTGNERALSMLSIPSKFSFPNDKILSLCQKMEDFLKYQSDVVDTEETICRLFLLKIEAFLETLGDLKESIPKNLKDDMKSEIQGLTTYLEELKQHQSRFQKQLRLIKNFSSTGIKEHQSLVKNFPEFASRILSEKVASDPEAKKKLECAIEEFFKKLLA